MRNIYRLLEVATREKKCEEPTKTVKRHNLPGVRLSLSSEFIDPLPFGRRSQERWDKIVS